MSSNQENRPREGDISSRPPKRSRLLDSTREEASEDNPEEHEGRGGSSNDDSSEISGGDDYGIAEENQQERRSPTLRGNNLCQLIPYRPEEDERRGNEVPSGTITCPICMDDYSKIVQSGRLIVSTKCGHLFCCCCLYISLANDKSCPVCRRRVIRQECHPIYI